MIVPTDAGKAFDTIQNPFMTNSLGNVSFLLRQAASAGVAAAYTHEYVSSEVKVAPVCIKLII